MEGIPATPTTPMAMIVGYVGSAWSLWLLLILAMIGMVIILGFPAQSTPTQAQPLASHCLETKHNVTLECRLQVPFIYIPPCNTTTFQKQHDCHHNKKIMRAVQYALEQYRNQMFQALRQLSQSLECILELEIGLKKKLPPSARLSTKWMDRIQNISQGFEEDEQVLQQLLQPVPAVLALPSTGSTNKSNHYGPQQPKQKQEQEASNGSSSDSSSNHFTLKMGTTFNKQQHTVSSLEDENAYDSAAQVVAHVVRDWTQAGAKIRQQLYDWCGDQLHNQFYGDSQNQIRTVLVPGAGVGRLAYDLYTRGYTVEANELSPVMASAAHGILHRRITGQLHPFLLDGMTNEVSSCRRYDVVSFPDTTITSPPPPHKQSPLNSLSFTVGNFASEYYYDSTSRGDDEKQDTHKNDINDQPRFDAIVTCFFIDTATNIYDYLQVIQRLLPIGGVWINVGPVQWHRNALLHPSVDELKQLILAFSFDIVHWSVDTHPIPYRQDDHYDHYHEKENNNNNYDKPFVRTTNYDAYRPLRFVAIRKQERV